MKKLFANAASLSLLPLLAAISGTAVARAAVPTPAIPPPVTVDHGWSLQDAAKVTATGDVVSTAAFRATDWYAATVPGTVLTSLVNDGVYPEPLYGENNRPDRIPESLCRTPYWYRTMVDVPRGYAGKRIWLRFEGINYLAEVWVNGHDAGAIQGAFARGLFDVTADVAPGSVACVAAEVQPELHPGTPLEQTQANGTGRNGGATAADGPTFLATVGWDWMPGIRDRDTGIWEGVTLSATGPVVVQDPYVTSDLPDLPRTDSADLTVQATVRNVTDVPQSGTLTGTAADGIAFSAPVTLGPSESKAVTLTPTTAPGLHVEHPHLWWPNGYGDPHLYTLHLAFAASDGAPSDVQDVSFGIRKITYAQPGSDNLSLSVNGVPVFCKGGDWGMDEAMKRIGPDRLEAQIRLHQLAHYTMIRNWVGQSTSDAFYDLCDRYGILVWDEFFQPNPSDGPDPVDSNLYLANVREKLLRYRTHPCIALWCARNEGTSGATLDGGIRQLIAELDTQRLYQASSGGGRGVGSGGPYSWRPPEAYYQYREAFKTEIGSVSIPTLEGLHVMMPASDWGEVNDDWAEHDLCRGAQRGDRYPLMVSERYGWVRDTVDFVRKAQLMNYEAYRAMYEARQAKLFNPETGVLTWMSNPAQPSFVWQLYSHDLEPLSSFFAVKKACEPVHIQMNQDDWHVMVIDNTAQPLANWSATTSVYTMSGRLAATRTDAVTAAASAATDLGAVAFPSGVTDVHFVKLTLRDGGGRVVSDNFYWRAAPNHPDDFTALDSLPTVALKATASRRTVAGSVYVDVTLSNPSAVIALMAHVQLRKAHAGERVLPVTYSDNYVSLLPGDAKTITIEAARKDAGDGPLVVAVDGWNVVVAGTKGGTSGVEIVSNREAMPTRAAAAAGRPQTIDINCGGPWVGAFGTDTDVVGGLGADSFPFRPGGFGGPGGPGGAPRPAGAGAAVAPPPAGATGPTAAAPSGAPPPGAGGPFGGPGGPGRGGFTPSPIVNDYAPVDTSAPNAAPAMVYQSARQGECAYAIPVGAVGTYTVRLHFAEYRADQPGARLFHVEINGRRVLTDFDIYAAAGNAQHKAVVRDFPGVVPGADGKIGIRFVKGSAGDPVVCGIQVIPEGA